VKKLGRSVKFWASYSKLKHARFWDTVRRDSSFMPYVRIQQVLLLHFTSLSLKNIFREREHEFTFAICCRPSVCRLFVCNARAPYLKFSAMFLRLWYLGHSLTSTENFTEIIPGEPLRREG